MLDDGTYEGVIVEASYTDGELGQNGSRISVEVTIATGPHKGEVAAVRGSFPGRPPSTCSPSRPPLR